MNAEINETANLLSLGLVFPTVVLGCVVIYTWFPAAKISIHKLEKDSNDWFILGVCFGFLSAIIHNLYWFFFWVAQYIELDITNELTAYGVIVNILTRQSMGIIAAYCHIKVSSKSRDRGSRSVNNLLVACNLVGAALMLGFFLVKSIM